MIFVKEAERLRFVRFNRAGDFFPNEEAGFFTAKDRVALAEGQMTWRLFATVSALAGSLLPRAGICSVFESEPSV